MDRRSFLKWCAGGIAATVALKSDVLRAAEQHYGLTGKINPETLLWTPGGDGEILLPPDKPLVIEQIPSGIAAYRLTIPRHGTYWFDRDGIVVDVLDVAGHPMSVLDGDGPDLNAVRKAIGDSWGWSSQTESKLVRHEVFARSRMYGGAGTLHRWPGLLPSKPERDFVARLRLEM